MAYTLFLQFREAPASIPRLGRTLVYTPERAKDPFLDDGAPPAMVVQGYFDSRISLEEAALKYEGLKCEAQALEVRTFPVPDPGPRGEPYCTYLVAYDGPAEDEAAWHAYYLEHHPGLMARLPGIRELEVYLPMEWKAPRGWTQVRCMQRNKVAFDSAAALTAALASPLRAEMRADYARLPRFSGRVTHYPMATRVVEAAC